MNGYVKGVLWFFGVIATFVFLMYLFGGIQYITAPFRGKVEAREQIQSADHRLYSYEYFYDALHSVRALSQQVQVQKDLLEQTTDENEKMRIRQNIAGMTSELLRRIEEYNSQASKIKTKGQFKSDELPVKLEYKSYSGKVNEIY